MLLLFLLFLVLKPCLPTSTACYNKGSETVKIGSKSSICLIISPLNWNTSTGEVIHLVGTFTVDVLSSFSVPGSWSSVVYKNDTLMQKLSISDKEQQGSGVGVIVATSGILSYQRAYRLTKSSSQTQTPTFQPTTPMPYVNSSSSIPIGSNEIGSTSIADSQEFEVNSEPFSASSATDSSVNSGTTTLNGITFPLLMVIVNVNNGVVKNVVWDDTCSWCGRSQCASNTYSLTFPQTAVSEGKNCYVNDDTCYVGSSPRLAQQTKAPTSSPLPPSLAPSFSHTHSGNSSAISAAPSATPTTASTAGPTATTSASPSISPTPALQVETSTKLCELKVYITWTGTDANGARLQSSAKRFSRLSNFQMTNFISSEQSTVSAV